MSSTFRRRPAPAPAPSPPSPPSPSPSSSAAPAEHDGDAIIGAAPPLPSPPPPPTNPPTAVLRRLPGTKAWTNNLHLTSFGVREIDALLGGGQPLGTAILLEEDRWTNDLAQCLARYWSAEAVCQGQRLALVATGSVEEKDGEGIDDGEGGIFGLPGSANLDGDDCYDDWDGVEPLDAYPSTSDLREFVAALPRNLHLDKARRRSEGRDGTAAEVDQEENGVVDRRGGGSLVILEEDEHDEGDNDYDEAAAKRRNATTGDEEHEDGLRIAWQYRASVQRTRLGHHLQTTTSLAKVDREDGVYCHSYDLSGRMANQYNGKNQDNNPLEMNVDVVDCSCPSCSRDALRRNSWACRGTRQCGMILYRNLLNCVMHNLSKGGGASRTVVRLLIPNAPVSALSVALPLLLSHARERSLPLAILATVRTWREDACPLGRATASLSSYSAPLSSLRRSADAVLAVDAFASLRAPPPPEFRDLAGILAVRRQAVQSGGHFSDVSSTRRPPADRYGVKRDRRKVHVRMLHLPPEEYSAGGGSVSGGGVRSGGGRSAGGDSVDGDGGRCGRGKQEKNRAAMVLVPEAGCRTGRTAGGASLEF